MDVDEKSKGDILDLVHLCEHFAAKVRASGELQKLVKTLGLSRVLDGIERLLFFGAAASSWDDSKTVSTVLPFLRCTVSGTHRDACSCLDLCITFYFRKHTEMHSSGEC